ncbi:cation transporter [Parvularcula sp. ZS-1/3]|uniref:Cation transporter n=1 Tax=Parvularcula mediterranea TaxID=2732508 RepID=A0A7Y3RN27_9PROT|nr:cation diffusion facilitator family transporter [Parvularcula mediterranea]NNU17101.1 cation transporter [Parvularcula mediterranea]
MTDHKAHDHVHHHGCVHGAAHHGDGSGKRLAGAFFVIAAFAVLEVIGGVISGSLALIADAGHMITDAAALGLAFSAQWLAGKPATDRFPFGLKRAQVLAAFINGLALIGIVAWLLFEAVERIGSPTEIDAPLMLTVAAVGLLANIVAFVMLHPSSGDNVNVRGAMLHVAADIFGSVAAIISALVIMSTGWLVIDPILTLAVCALILRSAIPLIRETATILMQAAPSSVTEGEVRKVLTTSAPVLDVSRVRAWQLTPGETFMSLQVTIPNNAQADEVLPAVKELLHDRFGVMQSTVEVETADVVALRRDISNTEDRAERVKT